MLSIAIIREVFGNGTFAGIEIPLLSDYKIEFFIKAPGGLMVYGIMIAIVNKITHGKAPRKKTFGCERCPAAATCGGACGSNSENKEEA